MKYLFTRLLVLLTLATPALAHAASLTLQYTGDQPVNDNFIAAQVGSVLTFDVIANFSDHPTIGGGFDILFDSDKLRVDSFTSNEVGFPKFAWDPVLLDGELSGWAFGSYNPLSSIDELVGTVTVTVLDGIMTGPGNIETRETTTAAGPFLDAFGSWVLPVNYNAYEVGVVPVPAAVWLFVSGCALLGGLHRRR